MSNLSDAEIIKTLECCSKSDCENCNRDWSYVAQWDCMRHIERLALDLINRLTDENEGLTAELEEERKNISILISLYKQAKSEAVKEFADKTNKMITEIYNKHIFGSNDLEAEEKDAIINFSDDVTSGIDNLLKEMG